MQPSQLVEQSVLMQRSDLLNYDTSQTLFGADEEVVVAANESSGAQTATATTPNSAKDATHELLQFHRNDAQRNTSILLPSPPTIQAQVSGHFAAVAPESSSSSSRDVACYRRNLFRVSGVVTLPRPPLLRGEYGEYTVVLAAGEHVPVVNFTLLLTASESLEGASVSLVYVCKKAESTAAAAGGGAGPPLPIVIDHHPVLATSHGDSRHITIPFAWDRLQFKHATAGNGKRAGLQQLYRLDITLRATLQAPSRHVCLAACQSTYMSVRGRNPSAFGCSSAFDTPFHNAYSAQKRAHHGAMNSVTPKRRLTMHSLMGDDDHVEPSIHQECRFLNAEGTSHMAAEHEMSKSTYEFIPLPDYDLLPPVDALWRPHTENHLHGFMDVAIRFRKSSKYYYSKPVGSLS